MMEYPTHVTYVEDHSIIRRYHMWNYFCEFTCYFPFSVLFLCLLLWITWSCPSCTQEVDVRAASSLFIFIIIYLPSVVATSRLFVRIAVCPMPFAHSSFHNVICASIKAALSRCPMLNAQSSLLRLICILHCYIFEFCPMLDAHSSSFGIICVCSMACLMHTPCCLPDFYILWCCIVWALTTPPLMAPFVHPFLWYCIVSSLPHVYCTLLLSWLYLRIYQQNISFGTSSMSSFST